ncbi:MAG: hypothetical protein Q9214_004859 [Letrouitia sp. 1 TL-2023]
MRQSKPPLGPSSVQRGGGELRDQGVKQQAQAIPTVGDPKPQKTISGFFSTSEARRAAGDTIDSPPSKRPKLDHISAKAEDTTQKVIKPDEMYNFSKPNHVDLTNATGSPRPSFPRKNINSLRRISNGPPESGPKRLIVKNLRKSSKGDLDQYYNHVWAQLDPALSAILDGKEILFSREELYRGVEILCRQDQAPSLFKKLTTKLQEGISRQYEQPLVAVAGHTDDIETLRAVVEAWVKWKRQISTIRSIFYYMDRSYLLRTPSLPSIETLGVNQFYNHIFCNSVLKAKTLKGACDLVRMDRDGRGSATNDDLFRSSIGMFHSLRVYDVDFEPEILGQSSKYFSSWSDKKAAASSLATYVEECQGLIDRERNRCDNFELASTTRRKLEVYLEDLLVDENQRKLLYAADVIDLLKQNAVEVLSHLFILLQRKGLEDKLRHPFERYINEDGFEIITDEEKEQQMVTRLLQFKEKLDIICERSFALHEGLGHSLREAFETFINKTKRSNMTWGTDNPKPGEMIAKHVDLILKGGAKVVSTAAPIEKSKNSVNEEEAEISGEDESVEINKQLDQVLGLFRFVHGKAVFEAFYKRDLARRLLLNRSASADAEKSMLTRLKSECGAGFTHNLEQMFKDMELAREDVSSYKSMLQNRSKDQTKEASGVDLNGNYINKPSIDLNVSVLSASAWPPYPDIAVKIPRNVQQATAGFEQFYKTKHSGRKLTWKHSLAHCQLKATFPRGNKELIVSSYQAVVLLAFNDRSAGDQMPYAEIQGATNLDDTELQRTLQSLACAKYRVLTKAPKGKEVNYNDTFVVNTNFSDPKYRIKINQIQAKETKEENKETHERVAADRNFEAQAAIVRIMKSRKRITHAELVSEVILATKNRGVLDPADIKKNIERLIDKDYMERDEKVEGRNIYNYVA